MRRPLTTILAAIASAVLLAGCGGGAEPDQPEPEEPALSREVAERLAAQSDAIAASLEAGDVCGAAHQADELVRQVHAAINQGDVPQPFQEELMGNAVSLQNDVNCPPPPAPPAAEEEGEDEEEEDKGKGRDNGKGKGKGNDGGGEEEEGGQPAVTVEEDVSP